MVPRSIQVRRLVLLVLIGLFIIVTPAFSASFDLGIVNDDGFQIFDIQSLVNEYFHHDFRENLSYQEDKQIAKFNNDIGKARHQGLLDDSEPPDVVFEMDYSIPKTETTLLDKDERLIQSFIRKDLQYLSDYRLAKALDAIVLISSVKIDSLIRCRVFFYDGMLTKVYEHICPESDKSFYKEDLIVALVPYFYPAESSLVIFDHEIPQFQEFSTSSESVILPHGTYHYEDKTLLVEEPVVHVTYEKVFTALPRLLITGSSNKIKLTSNGDHLGTLPIELKHQVLPLKLIASQDGYKAMSIQTASEIPTLDFQLRPSWMEDVSIYEDSRKSFYWSFARTLLLFGGQVLFKSIENNDSSYNTIGMVFSGLITVSIVDMLSDIIDYYRTSIYISQ